MGAPSTPPIRIVRFSVFELNLRSGELRRAGTRINLQEQSFQTLALLLEHPGDVVTREELRRRLWPADTFVDFERGLNAAIKRLRDTLGDSAKSPDASSRHCTVAVTDSSLRSSLAMLVRIGVTRQGRTTVRWAIQPTRRASSRPFPAAAIASSHRSTAQWKHRINSPARVGCARADAAAGPLSCADGWARGSDWPSQPSCWWARR